MLAEPIHSIQREHGALAGTFVDGGVSSVVPMLEAVRRGAERVLVLANYPVDPEPSPELRNAFDVLLRMLTLSIITPGPSEIERAELLSLSRRVLERSVCQQRLSTMRASETPDTPTEEQSERFCRRDFGRPGTSAPPLTSGWSGTLPDLVSRDAMRSAWVYRTEGFSSTKGYAFDPPVMRELFESGIQTFQARCLEMLDLLGIEGDAARNECRRNDAVTRARERFAPLASCQRRGIATCPSDGMKCSRK